MPDAGVVRPAGGGGVAALGGVAAAAAADLSALPEADPAMTGEAMGVTRRFVEYHLERRLDSMALLDA